MSGLQGVENNDWITTSVYLLRTRSESRSIRLLLHILSWRHTAYSPHEWPGIYRFPKDRGSTTHGQGPIGLRFRIRAENTKIRWVRKTPPRVTDQRATILHNARK